MIKKSHRHTIQDGRVVTFAQDFKEKEGIFSPIYEAVGPFSVSASRNRIIVHRASIRSHDQQDAFNIAVKLAWHEHIKLKSCNGRPDDEWDGSPQEGIVIEDSK